MNLWGLWVFGGAVIAAMAVISWLQSRSYRGYLARHSATAVKITEQQAISIAQQEALVAAVNRVAEALEKRS